MALIRGLIFISTFLVGSIAFIAREAACMAKEPRQTLMEAGKLGPARKSQARSGLDASFHFQLDGGVGCTGTYISETGHFATALHCISGCLAKNRAVIKEKAVDEPTAHQRLRRSPAGEARERDIYSYKLTVDEDKLNEGLVCPGVISTPAGEKRAEIKIVMTGGKGWLGPKMALPGFSKLYHEEYRDLLNDGYEHGWDFAILQVDEVKKSKCVKLAKQAPKVRAAVHAISYSCVNRDSVYSTGQIPLFTSGRRTAGFRDSDYYKLFQRHAGRHLPFREEDVERSDTFFSSLDIEKCGSGTGILDADSRLVGIATRVYKTSTDYEFGSLEAVDVAQLWKELNNKMTGIQISEITSCPSKSDASKSRKSQKRLISRQP